MIKKKSVRLTVLNLIMIGIVTSGSVFLSFKDVARYFPIFMAIYGFPVLLIKREHKSINALFSRYDKIVISVLILHIALAFTDFSRYSPLMLIVVILMIGGLYKTNSRSWNTLFAYMSLIWGACLFAIAGFLS